MVGLLSSACIARLNVPQASMVLCVDDGECAVGTACATDVGACRSSTAKDGKAPLLLSVASGSNTNVLLTFGDALSPAWAWTHMPPPELLLDRPLCLSVNDSTA